VEVQFFFFLLNFFFLLLNIGLFNLESKILPSSVINTTFHNITSLFPTSGGVFYINCTDSYELYFGECIFSSCYAHFGGALCFSNLASNFTIIRCRFENNIALHGNDISIQNGNIPSTIQTLVDSCTTSKEIESVHQSGSSYIPILKAFCDDKIVYFNFFVVCILKLFCYE
jgi:hypothetical protein